MIHPYGMDGMDLSHIIASLLRKCDLICCFRKCLNFLGERGERDNKPEPDPPQTRLSFQIRLHSFSIDTANPKKAVLPHLASK
jgi:hypothetical protein